jgi:CHRD domain
MKSRFIGSGMSLVIAGVITTFTLAASAADINAKLSGAQEVPPVQTTASGSAHFDVKDDMSISGGVKTKGIKGIAAHIHEGAAGKNGPVAVPLVANGDDEWIVAKGAKLTAAQLDELKAGNLYVNVHSEAHKDGEIRAQLKE